MSVLGELAERGRRAAATADAAARGLAGLHVLDTLGCVAAGASHPVARDLAALAGLDGAEDVRVLGLGGRRALRTAVLIEASLAHVDEYDAVHPGGAVVPAAVTVPAALAVADREGLPGRAVADAVLAGYEVVAEAGLRFGGPALYPRAWWPTAVFGALGAAAATAVLLDLGPERTEAALALAAAGLGGLLSADVLGTGHYLLAGRAAADGVEAAYLARAGADASRTLLDGPAAAALGRSAGPPTGAGPPHLSCCPIKRYPCARPLHAALDALTGLREEGVAWEQAETVEIALPSTLLRFVTAEREPAGPTEAAASAAFAVAALLHGRAGDARFYREPLPAGSPRVVLVPDPGLDALLPGRWAARVTLGFPDGGRAEGRSDGAREVGEAEVVGKWRRQLGGPGGSAEADAWRARCLALDAVADVAELRRDFARLLRPENENTIP
ncbi:2-methylcitrate dehydratase PrpD [Actinocorallia herbida]|uniref:2-methylcitrate dehydratase PrpD n=1 Tax=Actinocorallia herbida TaxID=58109 RepID=A0A3N1D0P7_9ACTN|nr:MmgE/PrpD family protein [Actinocorallia herbida]ROO87103.1 2-methylcitrate dehydratase PrpD [Actinocorallia herbida]